MVAARFYGVELAPIFNPGYDLIDRQGRRVQVKTLHGTPPRTIIRAIAGPCDIALAIRLDVDYSPREALEIPVDVAEEYTGKNGKVSWTLKLANDDRVRHITGAELLETSA